MEWVAISSSKGFSLPRDRTHISCVSCIGRWILHYCTTWEVVRTIRNRLCGNYQEINYTTELLHLCLSPLLSHYIKNIAKKLWEWCCVKIHGVHSATAIIWLCFLTGKQTNKKKKARYGHENILTTTQAFKGLPLWLRW